MKNERPPQPHKDHRKRVKSTFLKGGFQSFEPHNALEMLLFYAIPQGDTKALARRLIDHFGSFDQVLDADYESLLEVEGVGEHTAILLKLLPESYRYYENEKHRLGFNATSTSAALKYAKSLFVGERRELSYLLCFDTRLQLTNYAKVSEGSVNATAVTVRRVVELATLHRATSVILAHNHPGGNAVPSNEDILTTKSIAKALAAIGIDLCDHIIVGARDALSMADSGVLHDMKSNF